ncbi:MAG: hypothetical protein WCA46_30000 [Actinocatenispora sp.]
MRDDDLISAVQQPLASVHMDTPLEEVTRRGRALRTRRRLRGVTAVSALAGVAAVAGALLVPGVGGSGRAPAPGPADAPWTVTRVSDNEVRVSIESLKDPKGLEHELAANGIRARVEYNGYDGRIPPEWTRASRKAHLFHIYMREDGDGSEAVATRIGVYPGTKWLPPGCGVPQGGAHPDGSFGAIVGDSAPPVIAIRSAQPRHRGAADRSKPSGPLEFTLKSSNYPKGTALVLVAMDNKLSGGKGRLADVWTWRVVATRKCLGS